MELYSVDIEYADLSALDAWEKSLAGVAPKPKPETKKTSVFVAVSPDWSGDPVGRAASLAVERSICDKGNFEKYQPVVTCVRNIGHVIVERQD